MMRRHSNISKKSKIILICTTFSSILSTHAFSSFKTGLRSSQPKTNLDMGILDNVPTIMDSDASTTFGSISHLILDVGIKFIDPQSTACRHLLESIGQVFGLLSYCASNECIQSDELIYQALKISFSFLIAAKTTIPTIEATLNLMINPANCPLSSRDKQAYEDLFEPIGLSWIHYNTLKYNGAFEWISLKPNEKILLPSSCQNANRGTNLKDLTKRALEKEIYWLYQGSTNNKSINDIIFASNILQAENEDSSKEKNIIAGENGATVLKINSHKILKLVENDANRVASQCIAIAINCNFAITIVNCKVKA